MRWLAVGHGPPPLPALGPPGPEADATPAAPPAPAGPEPAAAGAAEPAADPAADAAAAADAPAGRTRTSSSGRKPAMSCGTGSGPLYGRASHACTSQYTHAAGSLAAGAGAPAGTGAPEPELAVPVEAPLPAVQLLRRVRLQHVARHGVEDVQQRSRGKLGEMPRLQGRLRDAIAGRQGERRLLSCRGVAPRVRKGRVQRLSCGEVEGQGRQVCAHGQHIEVAVVGLDHAQ